MPKQVDVHFEDFKRRKGKDIDKMILDSLQLVGPRKGVEFSPKEIRFSTLKWKISNLRKAGQIPREIRLAVRPERALLFWEPTGGTNDTEHPEK